MAYNRKFFCIIIVSIIMGIGDATGNYCDIDLALFGFDTFFEFVCWLFIGAFVAVIQLTTNMLLINFLNNVQRIKEKIFEE